MASTTLLNLKQRLADVESQIKKLNKEESDLRSRIEREKSNYDRFITTHSYNRLTAEYSLSQYGIWEVYGEDGNCDLAGSHTQPFLGLYEGELDKVIKKAVELSGFWAWGGGGDIRLHKPKKVTKVE